MDLQLAIVQETVGREKAQQREAFRKQVAAGEHKPATTVKYKKPIENFEARFSGYRLHLYPSLN